MLHSGACVTVESIKECIDLTRERCFFVNQQNIKLFLTSRQKRVDERAAFIWLMQNAECFYYLTSYVRLLSRFGCRLNLLACQVIRVRSRIARIFSYKIRAKFQLMNQQEIRWAKQYCLTSGMNEPFIR